VKFCMHVRLLCGQVFSHLGELWLAGSHNGGITSGMYAATNWIHAAAPSNAWWGFGIACRGSVGQSGLGQQHCLRPYGGFASCKPADALVTLGDSLLPSML